MLSCQIAPPGLGSHERNRDRAGQSVESTLGGGRLFVTARQSALCRQHSSEVSFKLANR